MDWILILVLLFIFFISFFLWSNINNDVVDLNKFEGNRINKINLPEIKKIFKKSDAFSLYNSGVISDYILGDSISAQKYYIKSLKAIKPNTKEKNFIIDKIKNRIKVDGEKEYDEKQDILPNIAGLKEILESTIRGLGPPRPPRQKNITNQPPVNGWIAKIVNAVPLPLPIKPIKSDKEEKIDKKIEWHTDIQNVHDHILNEQLLKQYTIIKNETTKSPMNFYEIKQFLTDLKNDESPSKTKISKTDIDQAINLINHIQPRDQSIVRLGGVTEEKFIGTLFNRILDSPNKDEILSSMVENMKESWSNGSPVCVTGRVCRMLSSFSHLDKNPIIGKLMTLQVLKNEIFGKAGKIQTDIINKLGNDEKNNYINNSNSQESKKIDEHIKSSIREMILKEYSEIADKKTLSEIIKEVESI
jgi:hypothetical protein